MSAVGEIQAPAVDSPEDDVRRAIEELKIETPPAAKVVLDNDGAANQRARDDEGKFAKEPKERKVITLPEKDAGVKAPDAQLGQAASDAAAAVAPVAAAPVKIPDNWKTGARAKLWETFGPEAQLEISQRETDIARGLTKQDDERVFGRKVSEIVSPYLPTIRLEGGTPEQAISQLLQTAHTLRQGDESQKANAVAAVMQQFKVSPQALFSILQGGNGGIGSPVQQGQSFDPRYESLAQSVARIEQERQQEIQQRQLQEQTSATNAIQEFSAKPGHEHFEKVRGQMGRDFEAGISADLEELYQRAIWADPEIRPSLIASQNEAFQGQRLADQTSKVDAKKSASVSVIGSPGGAKRPTNGAANPNSSIEDDIRASIREHSGRV